MTSPSDESYADRARAAQRKYRESHKDALNLRSREYHAANREKINARKVIYHRENKEKVIAYAREYRSTHKQEIAAKQNIRNKIYSKANRKSLNEKAREYREANKAELAARRKQWIADNPERLAMIQRRQQLKRIYRLTVDQWYALLEKQGGKCRICEIDNPGGRNWHTDHDHDTGEVRGILCGRCNIMLGHARDSAKILLAAVSYLSVARKKD